MEQIIKDKKTLFSGMHQNFTELADTISKLDDKDISEKIIYQFKYIIDDISRLNEDIKDMNHNLIYNHFDKNDVLKDKIEENEKINKIINDLMPLYIMKSMCN